MTLTDVGELSVEVDGAAVLNNCTFTCIGECPDVFPDGWECVDDGNCPSNRGKSMIELSD